MLLNIIVAVILYHILKKFKGFSKFFEGRIPKRRLHAAGYGVLVGIIHSTLTIPYSMRSAEILQQPWDDSTTLRIVIFSIFHGIIFSLFVYEILYRINKSKIF